MFGWASAWRIHSQTVMWHHHRRTFVGCEFYWFFCMLVFIFLFYLIGLQWICRLIEEFLVRLGGRSQGQGGYRRRSLGSLSSKDIRPYLGDSSDFPDTTIPSLRSLTASRIKKFNSWKLQLFEKVPLLHMFFNSNNFSGNHCSIFQTFLQ